ncbi:MAG: methyltransferase domain-containing protein [Polyangiaceae bacterium]
MTHPSENQAQIDFWNGPGADRWVREQERLDRLLRPFAELGLEKAAPRPGERAVDVGCGCGATTLLLSEAVGKAGSVLGVDISERMLARARERTTHMPWARFELGDAAEMRFSGDADLMFSRFGSMFFANPEKAFTNLRTALRSEGRFCLVCWRDPTDNPWFLVPLRAAETIVPPMEPTPPDAPGPFSFANGERLRRVFTGAGFSDVVLERRDLLVPLSTTGIDEAVDVACLAGPVARMLLEADAATIARVRATIREALAPYARADRVEMMSSVWLATARA